MQDAAAFTQVLQGGFPIPIIISAPHGGRNYPANVWNMMRDARRAAHSLEDRYADKIAECVAASTGAGLIFAAAPRALIDLNRAPEDMDWGMVVGGFEGGPSQLSQPALSPRARGGLGLVPRRLVGMGEIWNRALTRAELEKRIATIHSPYHQALEDMLQECREFWGGALLIDIHSMPPLKPQVKGKHAPQIVVGDRYGASAGYGAAQTALSWFAGNGYEAAYNKPYAGGYILERHSAPRAHIHALQIEICRSLYLDHEMNDLGEGFARLTQDLASFVSHLAAHMAAILPQRPSSLAAE